MSLSLNRNLALELVRVTEAAALAVDYWIGRGNKEKVDKAAVLGVRELINTISIRGTIVIGEGEKDQAPMLYNGEEVGNNTGPLCDVGIDPIDGTTVTAKGLNNSISVLAVADKGSMYNPKSVFYMNKIICSADCADVIDINAPVRDNLIKVAKRKNKSLDAMRVIVLDRPRHKELIKTILECGAHIKLISDGDIAGGILAAREDTGIDILFGIGGSTEGIITAAAMRCLNGCMQVKMIPNDARLSKIAKDVSDINYNEVYTEKDLVKSNNIFVAATAVTDGDLLTGIRYKENKIITSSLVMRSATETIRHIVAEHKLDKVAFYRDIMSK